MADRTPPRERELSEPPKAVEAWRYYQAHAEEMKARQRAAYDRQRDTERKRQWREHNQDYETAQQHTTYVDQRSERIEAATRRRAFTPAVPGGHPSTASCM